MPRVIRDANGKRLTRNVRRDIYYPQKWVRDVKLRWVRVTGEAVEAWGSNVWWGGLYGSATNVGRYYYATRAQARESDISDEIGKRGRVA